VRRCWHVLTCAGRCSRCGEGLGRGGTGVVIKTALPTEPLPSRLDHYNRLTWCAGVDMCWHVLAGVAGAAGMIVASVMSECAQVLPGRARVGMWQHIMPSARMRWQV
jgi:hypothetical protein